MAAVVDFARQSNSMGWDVWDAQSQEDIRNLEVS